MSFKKISTKAVKLWPIILFIIITFLSIAIYITEREIPNLLALVWLFSFSYALYALFNNGQLTVNKAYNDQLSFQANRLAAFHAKLSEFRFIVQLLSYLLIVVYNVLIELTFTITFLTFALDSFLLIYRKRKGLIV